MIHSKQHYVTGISGSKAMICIDNSGSNLEQAPCRQILLVVNDLIKKTIRGVKVFMAMGNLSLGKTFITCIVGRSFATECFYMKHETLLLRT
jgi:DNA helicase TIP49 (TBP-interacting protein)